MSVRERLKFYLKNKNITQESFSEAIGVSKGYVNAIRKSIQPDKISLIKEKFNDLNIEWLLTGDGEMIAMEGKFLNFNDQKGDDGVVREVELLQRREGDTVTQVDSDNYMEVEYRDLSVAAGPLNRTDVVEKKTMLVPREYDRGEYLVCRVDGPSMDDGSIYSIPEGAKILVKRFYLDNGDKLPIRGNLFVIDAKDGQALKQIVEHNTELGYIKCHSYNEDFADYIVPLEDVIDFYIFRKIVAFRPPVRDMK